MNKKNYRFSNSFLVKKQKMKDINNKLDYIKIERGKENVRFR